jgi:hypothetical protein
MINNIQRIGKFTSSEIAALMSVDKTGKSFGAPAKTYIAETNMERRLGRSLNSEITAKPTSWGRLLEDHVFPLLGKQYRALGTITMNHPTIDFWSGSPDAIKNDEGKTVVDIKSPYTLKSFCTLADCKTIQEVRDNHKEGEKYYFQLVSNAIITGAKYAELIIFCPYQSELQAIRELANNTSGNPNSFAWVHFGADDDLPYLVDGGYYKNLNIIRFEVPQADKDLLTARVLAAGSMLETVEKLQAA